MAHFLDEWKEQSEENARAAFEEAFILDVTEKMFAELERQGMTKADLAASMNKSKAYITQILNGSRNMTLRTLADIAYALDMKPVFNLSKDGDGWQTIQVKVLPPSREVVTTSEKNKQWSAGDVVSIGAYIDNVGQAA